MEKRHETQRRKKLGVLRVLHRTRVSRTMDQPAHLVVDRAFYALRNRIYGIRWFEHGLWGVARGERFFSTKDLWKRLLDMEDHSASNVRRGDHATFLCHTSPKQNPFQPVGADSMHDPLPTPDGWSSLVLLRIMCCRPSMYRSLAE